MSRSLAALELTPTFRRNVDVDVAGDSGDCDAVGIPVAATGDVPASLQLDRETLRRGGFSARVGQALSLPRSGAPATVAVGVGDELDAAALRHAAAAFARAVPDDSRLAFTLPDALAPDIASAAVVEGVLLGRYTYSLRGASAAPTGVDLVRLVVPDTARQDAEAGARRGLTVAMAAMLGRDLANAPGSLLTASAMADVAVEVAGRSGLQVEVFDKEALVELGCGGLLGVNQGSVEEPRMIRLRYAPDDVSGHLALVGKGIMYDSGGISLKPSDASHSTMKNDMTGAATVLAAMSTLQELGCRTAVTGYLMCTDNMPSGSALKLGDVLTMYGGRTVEVLNTDAEGRLVMADALAMAAEEGADAIVDIATLTGACLRTFGTEIAGVVGTDQPLVDRIVAAGDHVDEPIWQLPMARRYRRELDSEIADLTNMGGPNAGTITAALFMAEFTGDVPFAHIDIAGTAQADTPRGWVNKGATGSGTRLLVDLVLDFPQTAR